MKRVERPIICNRGVPAFLLLVLVAISGAGTVRAGGTADTFDEALEWIYADREEIISGRELLTMMDTKTIGEAVYLLDIRSPEEWEVSRLQDAEYVGYDDFTLELVSHIPRDAPVILYCAVGWRSGRIGETMREAGYTNLRDLYGGILLWTDSGFPVVNDQGRTQTVHGSQRRWGRWVQNPEIEVVY